ncbi:MAG: hypothetical protein IT355_12050 [Gemmatimonadaceae bacterium]|nr:hypothetical protein [Gemmatimonadaceae bacterium]
MALRIIKVRSTHPAGSETRIVRQQYNRLLAKVRELCVMLDADAGVTGTTYVATLEAIDGPSLVHIGANPAD